MIIFMDGFDHYVSADINKKWDSTSSTYPWPIIPGAGRRGGGAARQIYADYPLHKNLPVTTNKFILGCAMYCDGSILPMRILSLFDTLGLLLKFSANLDGSISAISNSTVLGTSLPGVLEANIYQYIEFKGLIDASSGTAAVVINGKTVLNLININTKPPGLSALVSAFELAVPGEPNSISLIDDLYVCDGTGPTENDFLGDCRIDLLRPVADGNYSDFSPSVGSEHWSLVDEVSLNLSDYVSSDTVLSKDSYIFSDLTILSTNVRAIQVNHAAIKTDAGPCAIASLVRSGTTDGQGISMPVSSNPSFYCSIHSSNPATSAAWTEAEINAAEFGTVRTE